MVLANFEVEMSLTQEVTCFLKKKLVDAPKSIFVSRQETSPSLVHLTSPLCTLIKYSRVYRSFTSLPLAAARSSDLRDVEDATGRRTTDARKE